MSECARSNVEEVANMSEVDEYDAESVEDEDDGPMDDSFEYMLPSRVEDVPPVSDDLTLEDRLAILQAIDEPDDSADLPEHDAAHRPNPSTFRDIPRYQAFGGVSIFDNQRNSLGPQGLPPALAHLQHEYPSFDEQENPISLVQQWPWDGESSSSSTPDENTAQPLPDTIRSEPSNISINASLGTAPMPSLSHVLNNTVGAPDSSHMPNLRGLRPLRSNSGGPPTMWTPTAALGSSTSGNRASLAAAHPMIWTPASATAASTNGTPQPRAILTPLGTILSLDNNGDAESHLEILQALARLSARNREAAHRPRRRSSARSALQNFMNRITRRNAPSRDAAMPQSPTRESQPTPPSLPPVVNREQTWTADGPQPNPLSGSDIPLPQTASESIPTTADVGESISSRTDDGEQMPEHTLEDELENPYVCRICLDGPTEEENLLAPCDCKGESAWVHRSCLQMWISSQKTNKNYQCTGGDRVCEICGAPWKGKWDLPSARVEQVEWNDQMALALAVAQFRIAYNLAGNIEHDIVRVLSPMANQAFINSQMENNLPPVTSRSSGLTNLLLSRGTTPEGIRIPREPNEIFTIQVNRDGSTTYTGSTRLPLSHNASSFRRMLGRNSDPHPSYPSQSQNRLPMLPLPSAGTTAIRRALGGRNSEPATPSTGSTTIQRMMGRNSEPTASSNSPLLRGTNRLRFPSLDLRASRRSTQSSSTESVQSSDRQVGRSCAIM